MGKRYKIELKRWDGGVSGDERDPAGNKCVVCKHFDIYSSPIKKLSILPLWALYA